MLVKIYTWLDFFFFFYYLWWAEFFHRILSLNKIVNFQQMASFSLDKFFPTILVRILQRIIKIYREIFMMRFLTWIGLYYYGGQQVSQTWEPGKPEV